VTVHEVLNADLVAPPLVPLKRLYVRVLNEVVAATATMIVFLSAQAEQRFVDSVGSVASKRLPHGVDTDARIDATPAEARAQLGIANHEAATDSTPVVVAPGYVSPRKGTDVVLSVARACPDVEFLVAGGPPRDRHTDFFDRIVERAPPNMTVTGRLSDEHFQLAFAAGDVAVLPYQETEQAGVVNAVNQSGVFNWCAAYGLPVLAGDCARFRNVAAEWDAVRVADATDPDAFADALQELLSDSDARTALSDAIEVYAQAHSVEQVAAQHHAVYQAVRT
jgi:glycosyltransferase involved in cell wall biosynthesis